MMRQTVFFFLGAIAVIAVFVFLILPGFIRIINAVFGGPEAVTTQDTLPPQVPVIQAPVEATFSAELVVRGFTEPKSKVVTVVNGTSADPQLVGDDGAFETTISLTEGENSFSLYAIDDAGNESVSTKTYQVAMDTTNPQLVLTNIEDGQKIVGKSNQNLSIAGETDPDSKVYVNEHLVFPNSEGDFSYSLRLNDGENIISVRAVDAAGNTTEKSVKVTFTP